MHKLSALTILLLLGLTSCIALGGVAGEVTPTPMPTSSIQGLKVVPSQACQVAQQEMIRVDATQGDLIAWSPVADILAYVASTPGSTWNVGELKIVIASAFNQPVRLATQVAGELSWSPEGLYIAYLGLRRSDNLYTIGLISPNGGNAADLFPGDAARTDAYSSQKAILGWQSEGRLRVIASCGVNCMQKIDFGVLTGLSTPLGATTQRTWDLWSVHTRLVDPIPPAFAELKGQLNWSPDESRVAYIDENGSTWVINEAAGSLYPLDTSPYVTAAETDWSYDGKYLAVNVDQYLRIYAFDCP